MCVCVYVCVCVCVVEAQVYGGKGLGVNRFAYEFFLYILCKVFTFFFSSSWVRLAGLSLRVKKFTYFPLHYTKLESVLSQVS